MSRLGPRIQLSGSNGWRIAARPIDFGFGRIWSLCLAAVAFAAFVGMLLPANVGAARPLELGLSDGLFSNDDAAVRHEWLDRAANAARADFVRIGVTWVAVAPNSRPSEFDPADPGDPAYSWETIDDAVRDARARGLKVFFLVNRAPRWAEGPNRPSSIEAGTWRPDPQEYRLFATAVARRYSGAFAPPGSGSPLPKVRHFQAWAEPNTSGKLRPQWVDGRQTGALIYRQLLNAFYRGIKSVDRSNVVVTGGTAPYGDDPGGRRTRPLLFWRTVMCLRANLRRAACPKPRDRARLDVFAHHPINTSGGPFRSALHRDDASSADMWKLRRTLRAAERHGTIRPGGRRPLWATEFWYHPAVFPDSLRRQARWIAQSLYLWWRQGASMALNFLIQDRDGRVIKSGLYNADGTKKPALTAFRFPFVAFKRGRRVELWGKAPTRGRVLIRRGGPGKWRRVTRLQSGPNRVFHARVRMRGKPRLQATRGGERSLVYKVR